MQTGEGGGSTHVKRRRKRPPPPQPMEGSCTLSITPYEVSSNPSVWISMSASLCRGGGGGGFRHPRKPIDQPPLGPPRPHTYSYLCRCSKGFFMYTRSMSVMRVW